MCRTFRVYRTFYNPGPSLLTFSNLSGMRISVLRAYLVLGPLTSQGRKTAENNRKYIFSSLADTPPTTANAI